MSLNMHDYHSKNGMNWSSFLIHRERNKIVVTVSTDLEPFYVLGQNFVGVANSFHKKSHLDLFLFISADYSISHT